MEIRKPAFECLTKYLLQFSNDNFGTWIVDNENDGTPEHPIHMPFVNYSEKVHCFINDMYEFIDNNPELDLNQCGEILERNGLEWNAQSMTQADVSNLNAQCILALLIGAIRAERFCDGALLDFFEDGSICKWLKRLKEIDGGII